MQEEVVFKEHFYRRKELDLEQRLQANSKNSDMTHVQQNSDMTPVQQKYCRSIESNYCPIIILSNIWEIHVKSFYQNRAVSNRANKCQFSCIWLGYALIKAYSEIQKAEDTLTASPYSSSGKYFGVLHGSHVGPLPYSIIMSDCFLFVDNTGVPS